MPRVRRYFAASKLIPRRTFGFVPAFGKSLAMLTAQPINQLCITGNDTLHLSWRQPDNDLM
jgi:hypothetical protein